MQSKRIEIPIFFSCDDNYIPFLSVAIHSLIENADKRYDYAIYILNSGLKKENEARILLQERENVKIRFKNVRAEARSLGKQLNLRDYYTAAIYFRIFIPDLFGKYKKAIYLDSDITVTGDISKLYFTELRDDLVGAVSDDVIASREVFIRYAERGCGIEYRKYFNSGVLLMNLELMREEDLTGRFIRLMKKYGVDTVCPDQDYLNALCRDRVLYLDRGWNKMSVDKNYDGIPNIIHFNMFNKPWQYDEVPYGEYFWKYAEQSDFYGDILKIKESFGKEEIEAQEKGLFELISNAERIANSDVNFRTVLFPEDGSLSCGYDLGAISV